MNIEEIEFLRKVEQFIHERPHMMSNLLQAAQSGLTAKTTELHLRAVDMETVAALALEARVFNTKKWYIVELLNKWAGKTSLDFTYLTNKLSQSLEKK